MVTFLVLFLSLVTSAALCVFGGFIDAWYDFYWAIIFFIGGFLGYTLLTIVLLFIANLFMRVKDEPNEKYSKAARFVMDEYLRFMCLWFRLKITCSHEELLPKDTRYLLVSNHISDLDPIATNAYFRGREISWVAKKSLFRVPIAKAFMYKCNFLCMDRDDIRQSLRVINKAASYIKDDIVSIGIYPEGTRNMTEEPLLPFKPGALKIAQKAGVPIVVMTISNTHMAAKRWPWRSTRVYIDLLKVFSKEEVAARSTNDISAEIEELMKSHLAEVKSRKV